MADPFRCDPLELARKARGLSKTDLAAKCGIPVKMITKLESTLLQPQINYGRLLMRCNSLRSSSFNRSIRLGGLIGGTQMVVRWLFDRARRSRKDLVMADLPEIVITTLRLFDELGEAPTYDVFKLARDREQHLTLVSAFRATGWLARERLIEVAGTAENGHTTYRVTDAGRSALAPTTRS